MESHKHSCLHLGTPFQGQSEAIWEHTDMCAFVSTEVFHASHSCPICGVEIREKYYGIKIASYIGQCEQPVMAVLALPAAFSEVR